MKLYTEHMLVCPKCKNMNISGPVYKPSSGHVVCFGESLRNTVFPEHMEWTCGDCGYVEATRCCDYAPSACEKAP